MYHALNQVALFFALRNQQKQQIMEKSIYYMDCHVAGFKYWDGIEVFNMLRIGEELRLVREKDNAYDAEAIAVYWKDAKLGFIPSTMNTDLSKFLDMGHEDIFKVFINRISPEKEPNSQIGIVIKIRQK